MIAALLSAQLCMRLSRAGARAAYARGLSTCWLELGARRCSLGVKPVT
jgi:hypothetical protein